MALRQSWALTAANRAAFSWGHRECGPSPDPALCLLWASL